MNPDPFSITDLPHFIHLGPTDTCEVPNFALRDYKLWCHPGTKIFFKLTLIQSPQEPCTLIIPTPPAPSSSVILKRIPHCRPEVCIYWTNSPEVLVHYHTIPTLKLKDQLAAFDSLNFCFRFNSNRERSFSSLFGCPFQEHLPWLRPINPVVRATFTSQDKKLQQEQWFFHQRLLASVKPHQSRAAKRAKRQPPHFKK